ncbi:hypothetical protein OXX79_000550 [Metschnikowia pulcherrima]
MVQDRIVLHYLTDSRASRIVWLLEELQLEYETKVYKRTTEFLAPPELKSVWPLGLSPVVQVFKSGDPEPITLAESGQIVSYLIKNYDTTGKFEPETERDAVLVEYYLHFAEGTLEPHIVSLLVGYFASQRAPLGFGWLVKRIMSQINSQYYLKKLRTNLKFLDSQLQKKGDGFFVGNKLTGADFILDYPINNNIFLEPERLQEIAGGLNPAKEFPHLAQWNKFITERPLHIKAVEKETQFSAKL